jgi:hypothetical protein
MARIRFALRLPDLEFAALDLAGCGHRQVVDELDGARALTASWLASTFAWKGLSAGAGSSVRVAGSGHRRPAAAE